MKFRSTIKGEIKCPKQWKPMKENNMRIGKNYEIYIETYAPFFQSLVDKWSMIADALKSLNVVLFKLIEK